MQKPAPLLNTGIRTARPAANGAANRGCKLVEPEDAGQWRGSRGYLHKAHLIDALYTKAGFLSTAGLTDLSEIARLACSRIHRRHSGAPATVIAPYNRHSGDPTTVIPAQAGIYGCRLHYHNKGLRRRIRACAGMTVGRAQGWTEQWARAAELPPAAPYLQARLGHLRRVQQRVQFRFGKRSFLARHFPNRPPGFRRFLGDAGRRIVAD